MVKNKLKILVADEIAVNRNLLCEILTEEYDILQAKDGLQIISMTEEYRDSLALILMNYIMPVKSGDEVLQEMKKMNLLSIVPVIVVTDLSNSEGGVRALELGATDVVHKPIEPSLLKKRIQNVLNSHQLNCLPSDQKQKYHSKMDGVVHEILELTDKLETYKKENKRLVKLSKLDTLTEVYDRDSAYELVANSLQEDTNKTSGFMLVEFSNVQKIVEKYGIEKGKRILQIFGKNLTAHFEENAIIGRIETSCFLVFLKEFQNNDYLKKKAQSIIDNIKNAEVELEENDKIIVSIGVAISPENGKKYNELFFYAQKMMNKGKSNFDEANKSNSFLMIEDDVVQDIVKGNTFFEKVHKLVSENLHKKYFFIRIDILEFKKFTELNGYVEGEKLLDLLSQEFFQFVGDKGVAGQIYTDTFGACIETDEKEVKEFLKRLEIKLYRRDTDIDLTPYCGIYKRIDSKVSVIEMCNYAGLACQKAKQSKDNQIVVYYS